MVMFNLVIIATATGVAVSLRRERAARRAREFQEEARRQVLGERFRIARDLHDMVAHHLTLVNAQASVAEYLMRDDPKAAAALSGISLHSRQALDDLRATVGLLRSDGDTPQDARAGFHSTPGIDKLDELATVSVPQVRTCRWPPQGSRRTPARRGPGGLSHRAGIAYQRG